MAQPWYILCAQEISLLTIDVDIRCHCEPEQSVEIGYLLFKYLPCLHAGCRRLISIAVRACLITNDTWIGNDRSRAGMAFTTLPFSPTVFRDGLPDVLKPDAHQFIHPLAGLRPSSSMRIFSLGDGRPRCFSPAHAQPRLVLLIISPEGVEVWALDFPRGNCPAKIVKRVQCPPQEFDQARQASPAGNHR